MEAIFHLSLDPFLFWLKLKFCSADIFSWTSVFISYGASWSFWEIIWKRSFSPRKFPLLPPSVSPFPKEWSILWGNVQGGFLWHQRFYPVITLLLREDIFSSRRPKRGSFFIHIIDCAIHPVICFCLYLYAKFNHSL